MPRAPRTWSTFDWPTASLLNQELRLINGQPYLANGPGWHAQRPVYKSFLTANITQTPGAGWIQQFNPGGIGAGSWTPVVDTAAFLGGKGDVAAEGGYNPGGLTDGGGANSPAGISLVWTHQPMNTGASGTASTAGIGLTSGSSPLHIGTAHGNNANSQGTTPWCASLMDTSSRVTGYYNGSVGPAGYVVGTGDGSGLAPRQHAIWASVYPGNGTTVGSIPTITTGYSPTSSMTAAGLNTNIQQAMRLLNMPPMVKVQAQNAIATSASTNATINYSAGSVTWDTYGGFNTTTSTYTVPLPGLYLVIAFAGFDNPGAGRMKTGVLINGTQFPGPTSNTFASAACSSSKVQIFSLNAGDTIQHYVFQANSPLNTSTTNPSNMHILWLGAAGAPASLPSVPDYSYLFQAGTPGSQLPGVFNANLANDLSFLIQKPYTMAYQTAAQAAFGNNSPTSLQLQSVTGQAHGDSAVSYGGYSTSSWNYTAPRSGWYLCVQEFFMNTGNNLNDYYVGGFNANPQGVNGVDKYEQKTAWSGTGGGASAMGLYYLRAGDVIAPVAVWLGHTGTNGTDVTVGHSHFEAVWVSA